MMKRIWIFLSNTFLVVTKGNFRKMFLIGTDHLMRLESEKADPDIAAILVEYRPVYEDYRITYSESNVTSGLKEGETKIFNNLLGQLTNDWLPAWETEIRRFYPKNTPQYLSIFPNGRDPFTKPTYEEILLALETLARVVKMYDPIKALEIDILDKYNIMDKARLSQSSLKFKTEVYSDELEEKRIELGELLYGILGKLMYKFRKNPAQAERFYKLSLLRRSSKKGDEGVSITDSVPAGGLKAAVFPDKLVVTSATTYTLMNQSSETSFWLYFAANASTLDSDHRVTLDPNMAAEATAADLGWSAEKPVLIVRNIGFAEGVYEVVVFVEG